MSNFLEGKKTYIGLVLTIFGMVGGSNLISNEEVSQLLNSLFEVVGILFAAYGRYVTKK